MSSLTAEQRQRIEENRRKALQKLQSLKGSSGGATSSGSNSVSSGSSFRPSGSGSGSSSTFKPSFKPSVSDNGSSGIFKSSSSFVNPLSKGNVPSTSNGGYQSSSSSGAGNMPPEKFTPWPSGGTSQPAGMAATSSGTSDAKPASKGVMSQQELQRKIEENRRKALEKRALSGSANTPSSSSGGADSANNPPQVGVKTATNFYNKSSGVSSSDSGFANKSQPSSYSKGNQGSTFSNSSATNKYGTSSYNSSKPSNSGFSKSFNKGNQNPFKGPFSAKSSGGPMSSEEKMVNSVLNEYDDNPKPVSGRTITGTFRLMSRERFVVDVGYHKQMIEIFKTMSSRKYDVETRKWNFCLSEHDPLVEALKPLRPDVCISPLPQFVRKTLQTAARQMPASCVDLFGLDPKLLDALMPFQHDGVCFGVNLKGRVMIADDMGLGKTIQALGIAVYYRREWPLLIVTPSSVRYSWVSAIERWVTTVDRQDISVLNTGKDHIDDAQVVITSYDLLSRRRQELQDRNFQIVIMDESHMLKSFKTARYKAAYPIMKQTKRLILLSGTPALSRPSELYTQISGIDPSLFPRFQDYGVRYCAGKQTPWGWDFNGSSNMEELQIILEARLMIRRLKSEVLEQLPSKQRMMVILDPGMIKCNTRSMEEAAKHFGSKSLKGAEKHGALLQFFAESAVAKLKAVSEYIKELLEGDSKFLVFAHHRVMLDKLCQTCDNINAKYIRIDGRTSGGDRQQLVNKFQTNDSVRVAILSITAANAGITLTAAQLVVFAEVFWNPGILVQAEDRAHRIGQQDCVTVQYLVGKGTVDDHIWPLVQSKLEVLSKAGLSKETSLSGEATYQKDREQGSIESYLVDLGDNGEIPEDPTDDEPKTEAKKTRKGGILEYFSQDKDGSDDEEPQRKKLKS